MHTRFLLWSLLILSVNTPAMGDRPLLLVHYLPWFAAKPASAAWGWHWSMDKANPDHIVDAATGRREIASYNYPLIGPYDSLDPAVLEYHALLMKRAGLDGAILDWYGTDHFFDYADNHRRTLAMIDALKKVGLSYALCYEDHVIRTYVDSDKQPRAVAAQKAVAHFQFADEHWFGDPAYVRIAGQPLVLVFGPDYLESREWAAAFAGLKHPPRLYTLNSRRVDAPGQFAWPPMHLAGADGVLSRATLDRYLADFDRAEPNPNRKLAFAFPGFHDFVVASDKPYGARVYPAADGATFRHSLDRALASGAAVIQFVTWNDYGEATTIEPAEPYGYRYLEMTQEVRHRIDPAFSGRPDELRLIRTLYDERKQTTDARRQQRLDRAASDLANGDIDGAKGELAATDR